MFLENAWAENRANSENDLIQTLENLAGDFSDWIFKNKEDILKKIDKENAKPGHLISKKTLKKLEDEPETWTKIENIYWLENDREKFFKEHDICTRYFHMVASNRKRHNTINNLRDESDLWIEGKDQLDLLLKKSFC